MMEIRLRARVGENLSLIAMLEMKLKGAHKPHLLIALISSSQSSSSPSSYQRNNISTHITRKDPKQ